MRVLVAYDPKANDPLPIADLQRAGLPSRCEVLVLCVADVLLPPAPTPAARPMPVPPRVQDALDEAGRAAADACARLRAVFAAWTISVDAIPDAPAWGIIRAAERWHADLIVLGARRLSALARLTLGSVSQKVLREAACTVRIVKGGGTGGGIHPPRLLIGIDGSSYADAAAAAVAAREWPRGTTAHLVSVIDPVTDDGPTTPGSEAAAQARLDQLAETLSARGVTPATAVRTGDAKDLLLEEAERHQVDCIFVGARGLSAIERILLGSVSASLAAHASCSVEVVRPSA